MPDVETVQQTYWTREDTIATRQFMQGPTWVKIIELMKAAAPEISTESIEKSALTARDHISWEKCLNKLAEFPAGIHEDKPVAFDDIDMSVPRNYQ